MGTVQKILESLNRISDDKKGQLTARYIEHSTWMKSELDMIRSLIKKNPRDDHTTNDENAPPVESNVVNSSSNRSSSEKNEDESAIRQKRKSPEMNMLGSRNSPDLKRNSTQDYEELAASAGLPTDLNRLKKEQLLEELESRGNVEFSMKSLKKDLVDALKDALSKCSKEANNATNCDIDDHNKRLGTESSQEDIPATRMSEDNVENVPDVTANGQTDVEIAPASATELGSAKKLRNGSLMAEFRNLINNPAAVQNQSVESESDRAVKIQNEYQARQQRHRQSQTGKLPKEQAALEGDVIPSPKPHSIVDLTEDDESNAQQSEQNVEQTPHEQRGNMDLAFSPAKPSPVEVPCPASPCAPTESMRMELGSPAPVLSSPAKDITEAHTVTLATPAGAKALGMLGEGHHCSDRERESMSSTSTYSTITSSLSMAFNTNGTNLTSAQLSNMQMNNHSTAAVSSITGMQSGLVKKPSNLLGGQSTFIEKAPAPEKPTTKSVIVPALERARQAKLAEEAKAAQKKKDLEKKIATLNANSSAASAKLNSSGPLRPPLASQRPGQVPTQAVRPTVSALSKSQPLSGISSGSATLVSSQAALNPFATATSSSMNRAELADLDGPDRGIYAFLATKKTPDSAVLLSVPTPAPASVAAPVSAPASEGVAVPVKSTRRRTLDGQAPKLDALPPASVSVSSPIDDNASVSSGSTYATAPLPSPTTPQKEEGEEEETFSAPSSPPMPISAPAVPAVSPPRQTASVPSVIPVLNPVTPITAPRPETVQAPKREVAIIEEEEEEEEVQEKQYEMDDKDDSSDGGEDDSGTDEDETAESEQEKQKRIPEWARGVLLKEALEKQYGLNGHTPMDPDSIFHEVQTCSLEEIFGTKEGRCGAYAKRTSSAAWDHDSLSLIEKRTYRSQMGYGGIHASGGKR